jgi:4-aminobutyrate aminotransferase-like enzyme
VIKEIEDKKFVERSKNLGDLFRKELWKLKEKHSVIGDIRGSGLMIGVEFMESQTYGAKGNKIVPATAKARAFVVEALKHGIILLSSGPDHNVISITPPFVISEKEIHYCIKSFDKILSKLH